MTDKVEIHLKNTNEKKQIPIGTSLEDIIKIFNFEMPYLITNARVNNRTESLVMNIEQVNVVEEGNYPTAPASPNVKIYVIFGALLGMFVSVLVVIIRFMMDDTIKTGDDEEKYLGLSMLAAIPYSEELDIVKNGSKKSKNNKSKNSSKKKA